MNEIKEKMCFKCGNVYPLSNFYKHPQMADGHVNKCKDCNKKDVADNYQSNREHYAAYEQERFQRPERKAATLEYQRRARSTHPDKFKARSAVSNALRDGYLQRQPCEKCGNEKSQAHHPDYSRPLDVEWLCFRHHREAHGQVVIKDF
jgi:hypothetical protein